MMFGLEFGCGDTPRKKNFAGVDVRPGPTVQYLCNAWEISDHVAPNTVDEIFSRHFFEHLTFEQGRRTLDAWYNILKLGGKMEIILPDMAFHIKQWNNANRKTNMNKNGMTDIEYACTGFWGQQRGKEGELWDVHKSGYDYALLCDVLTEYKFNNIARQKSAPKNLHVICWK